MSDLYSSDILGLWCGGILMQVEFWTCAMNLKAVQEQWVDVSHNKVQQFSYREKLTLDSDVFFVR
jgi:hypothetical protein